MDLFFKMIWSVYHVTQRMWEDYSLYENMTVHAIFSSHSVLNMSKITCFLFNFSFYFFVSFAEL